MDAEPAGVRPVRGTAHELLPLVERWVHDGGEPLVVRTSGSSGEPKAAVLSHAAVLASAHGSLERLGGPGQWLAALPPAGVGGLQVLVRSALHGSRPVVAGDYPDLAHAVAALEAERRYASLVPTQLYRLDAAGCLDVLAGLDAVLLGGAAVDPDLLARAGSAGVTVVRSYGMTETCGGCVYDGLPLEGVQVRVAAARAEGGGQIEIAGPVLFDGYVGEPRTGAWFGTDDLGEIDDQGRLRVLGRRDEVVVSGGVKIALPAVERALRGVDGIRDLAVVGVEDAEWGSRVVAVLAADPVCLTGLDDWSLRNEVEAAGLPRSWGPREVLLVDEIPMLAGGKPDRRRLRELAAGPR